MNKLVGAAIAVGVFAVALNPVANAAPTGPQTVDQVVNQLRSQGYHVIVSRIGAAPSDRCSVREIRPGHTYSHSDSGAPGAGSDIVTTVTSMTVYVDVNC